MQKVMKKKHRNHILLLPAFLSLLLFVVALFSATVNAAESFIKDEADIFTASEEQEMQKKAQAFSDELGIPIYVLTNSNVTTDRQTYAETYYYNNDLGTGSDDGGVLIYISMNPDNRGWWTHVEGDYHFNYTEKTANEVDDVLYEYMVDGKYGEGIINWIGNMKSVLKTGHMPTSPLKIVLTILVGIAAAVVGLFIVYKLFDNHMTPVKHQTQAKNYLRKDTMQIQNRGDQFLYTSRVSTKIEKNKGGGHGGGSSFSSSSHSSGSGRSF